MKTITQFALLLFFLIGTCLAAPDKYGPATNLTAAEAKVVTSGDGYGSIGFQFQGTWDAEITFEASIDNVNWTAVRAANGAGTIATTAAENGVYVASTAGYRFVRARVSTYTSGTIIASTMSTFEPFVASTASGGGGGAEGSVDVLSIAAGNNNIGNIDVVTLPALPAGTNNIGDIDVLSLPALPAGTNNIGDIDVLSLPALPAGTNNIGDIDVLTLPALAAGNNNVGDVDVASIAAGDNNIGDVDIASVVPGTGATNLGKAEDGAHTSADVGVMALGVRRDANTTMATSDGDYGPLQLNADGSLKVAITAGAGSGGTSAADDGAFTPASGSVTPIGGFADETSPDVVDEGDVGAVRMTTFRALHVNMRDASGNELSAGNQYAEDAAHADGNFLMMAGAVRRNTPASSTATDGDNATLNTDPDGFLYTKDKGTSPTGSAVPASAQYAGAISRGNLTGIIQADTSVIINMSTATTTQVMSLTSAQKIYVTAWNVIAAGTGTIKLVYGTGTNCGTGTADLTPAYSLVAQAGIATGTGLGPVLFVPAGNALCVTTSAAVGMQGTVSLTKF
jgi:hypothetical protein